jgi:hypothetical protein
MVKVNRVSHLLSSTFSSCVFTYLIRPAFISFLVAFSFTLAFAQDDNSMPDDVAPPPLKIISKEEKDQLSAESGVKDRASLYIDLLEARLKKAEDLSSRDDFVSALGQFGSYEGLLENMMNFLTAEKKDGKALWSFKKLELVLRGHNIRIETIRRIMPFKYAYHVTRLERVVRKSRAEATESLFSDSVVRIPDEKKAGDPPGNAKAEQKP